MLQSICSCLTVLQLPTCPAASPWSNNNIPPTLPQCNAGKVVSPYQRVIMFVDNAGADVVLGMLPFARELLRMGAEVRWAAGGRRRRWP